MNSLIRIGNILSSLAFLFVFIASTADAVEIEQRQYDVFVSNTFSMTEAYRIFLYPQNGLVILHGDIAVPISVPPQTIGILGKGLPESISNASNVTPSDFFTAFSSKASVNYWGDFNGDGKTDLFVYVPTLSTNQAYIIYGGLSTSPTVTLIDNSILYDFSTSTFSVRDVNGDGISDIVLMSADGMEYVFTMAAEYANAYQVITGAMLVDAPEQAATDVGITAGDFNVSPAGSAQYTIPVMTGASTGSVKPSVSISYDSAAGNGLAGWGWNLNAGSAISRCRNKPSGAAYWQPILFDNADAYCLDGQQLVFIGTVPGGFEYRTEIDSYRRIVSYGSSRGSPTYWRVQGKDGSSSVFGATADSKQNLSSSGKILSWAISRMLDSAGNYIDYEYSLTGNNLVLNRIKYAGNVNSSIQPSNSIEFEYSQRADSAKSYVAGYEIVSKYRLERIRSLVNGYELRSYHLNYLSGNVDQTESLVSHLKSVQECVASNCLKPTKFDWSYPKPVEMWFHPSWTDHSAHYETGGGSPIDVNGDGRMDILLPRISSEGHKYLELRLSDGVKLNPGPWVRLHNSDPFDRYAVIDYNGDGHQDIIESSGDEKRWIVWLARNNGSSWTLDNANYVDTGVAGEEGDKASFSDFNGDGLLDMIYPVSEGGSRFGFGGLVFGYEIRYLQKSAFHNSAELPYSYGAPLPINISGSSVVLSDQAAVKQQYLSGTIPPAGIVYRYVAMAESAKSAADFNGDGRADVIAPVIEKGIAAGAPTCDTDGICSPSGPRVTYTKTLGWMALTSSGDSNFKQYYFAAAAFSKEHIHTADFNGDGLTDILYRNAAPNGSFTWSVSLTKGSGPSAIFDVLVNQEIPGDAGHIGFFDMSGDGNADIVALDGAGDINFFSLTGTGFVRKIYQTNIEKSGQPIWGDYDGDGSIDAVTYSPDGSDEEYYLYLRGPFGFQQNAITRITNGFGAKTEISYLPMIDTNVYTVGTGANQLNYSGAPVLDIMASSYLVSSVKSSAPSAGAAPSQVDQSVMAAVGYAYSGARLQGWGRGQLGFQKITTVDYQNNVKTETVYRQDFPFIGLPSSTTQKKMSGSEPLLSQAINDWRLVGTNAAPYRVNLNTVLEQSYDNDAAATGATKPYKYVTTTKDNVDEWGNPGKITVITQGSGHIHKQVTESSYTNADTEYRRLGRVTDVTTTSTVDDAGAIARASHFDYYTTDDSKRYLLQQETLAYGDPVAATVTQYEYDSFGNKAKVIRKGRDGLADRYTRYVYSSDGRFLDQTYNSYEQLVEDVSARDNYGRVKQVADVDDINTYFVFDAFGREVERRRDFGLTTTTSYNACYWDCATSSYSVQQDSSDGSATAVSMDMLGRESKVSSRTLSGGTVTVFTEYDNRGKVRRKSQPTATNPSYWSEYFYDDIGRLLTEATAGTSVSNIVHQYGVVSFYGVDLPYHSVTNERAQTSTTYLDALGREAIISDASGGTVVNTYDSLGNLKQVDLTAIAASGSSETRKVEMSYNVLGQREKLIDPDKGTLCFWYNAFGEENKQARVTNLKRYTDSCSAVTAATSQTIETTYDKLGRATKKTYKNGAATVFDYDFRWTYDNTAVISSSIGKLTQAQDVISGYVETYSYDASSHKPISTGVILPDGQIFSTSVQYDSLGRVSTTTDAAGGTVQNTYDALSGLLKSVRDVGSNKTYYEVTGMDAYGHTTTAKFTQVGVTLSRAYNAETGRLQSVAATDAVAGTLQNISVNWDSVGNLLSRGETIAGATKSEYYCYDKLNRLIKTSTTSVTCSALTAATQSYEYDGFGGIKRNGTSTMLYEKTGNAGPNAVTKLGTNIYAYDTQGNLTSDTVSGTVQRSFTYNLMDKPKKVTQGSNATEFFYGPGGGYYKRVDVRSGQPTTTTFYVGGIEIVRNGTSNNERTKRYITGDIVVETEENSSGTVISSRQYYLLRDHLGSVYKVLEPASNGSVVAEQMSFDAFGKRRNVTSFAALAHTTTDATYWSAIINNYNRRTSVGYTGHQEVDLGSPDQGLVHMGGRMYDPRMGRFLSADPIIQAPNDLQSYNRYAYVRNNPLVLTDPSGYSWWGEHVTPHGEQIVRTAAAIAITWATAGAASELGYTLAGYSTVAAGGYVAGYVATGSGQGALRGAFTAVAFFGVGQIVHGNFDSGNLADIGTTAFSPGDFAAATAMHGLAGGIIEDLYGGNFGHGFLNAFINKAAAGPIDTAAGDNFVMGAAISAVVGGTISDATGGKFENGAITASMQFALNQSYTKLARMLVSKMNARLAGAVHDSGVRFTKDGFADLSEYAIDSRQIKMTGNRTTDAALANEAAGLGKTPDGYVWHHSHDLSDEGMVTMELVPQSIHNSTGHTGGVAIYKMAKFLERTMSGIDAAAAVIDPATYVRGIAPDNPYLNPQNFEIPRS